MTPIRSQRALAALALACSVGLAAGPALAADPVSATATFHDVDGKSVGTARLTQTAAGVLIDLDLTGLQPGERAFHIHETGTCDAATKFESAGGHFNPGDHAHGFTAQNGPHAGDMPNLVVPDSGALKVQVLNTAVALDSSDHGLMDSDGAALVIHDARDDYATQPTGDAGGRFACAAIAKP
ncbi:superoxide dismutase family protein [Zavarzinia sp. CC-PAN008]|uniref:superoxide dismutase family protein n=1 Tax=Zavarzinia sp. CC-PAN008 TaxID=3243332 RepID=UPI003F7467D9